MINRTRIPAGRVDIMRNPGSGGLPHDIEDVMISYQYHNRTDRTLRITNRNGVSFDSLPSQTGYHTDEFVILVYYKGNPSVIKNMAALLYSGANKGQESERIYRALKRSLDGNKGSRRQLTAVVEYAVKIESLSRLNGRMYLNELDIVIEEPVTARMVHPFNSSELGRKDFESLIPAASDRCFLLSYRVIDNSGQRMIADRYVNIGGEVYRIPVEADPALKDGIHVAKRNPIFGANPMIKGTVMYTHLSYEDGDKTLGLFLSAEQARAGGSYHDFMKDQLNAKSTEDKVRTLELERELQDMRNELNRRKIQADLELNPGKTTLEWLKIGTGAITALVTVYTLWQKVKPVKPTVQPDQPTRPSTPRARNAGST